MPSKTHEEIYVSPHYLGDAIKLKDRRCTFPEGLSAFLVDAMKEWCLFRFPVLSSIHS